MNALEAAARVADKYYEVVSDFSPWGARIDPHEEGALQETYRFHGSMVPSYEKADFKAYVQSELNEYAWNIVRWEDIGENSGGGGTGGW